MALFSRRTLQRILNENTNFLNSEQSVAHVKRLNEATDLSTEWEIVMLNAFSKLGNVIHEPKNLGNRQIDLCFCASENIGYSFVADITTVSDDGLDKNNPQHLFMQELHRILKKYNLDGKGFSYRINGQKKKNYKLKLENYSSILNGNFVNFLKNKVLTDLSSSHTFTADSKGLSITISYIPNQRYLTGSHPSYTATYTVKNNPVYNGLKTKSDQLRELDYNGPKGIIICDGSCSLLKNTNKSAGSYTGKEVIQDFLNNTNTIDFVITVVPYYQSKKQAYTKTQLYLNPQKAVPIADELNQYLSYVNKYLPLPISNVQNARYRLLDDVKDYMRNSFFGGLEMTSSTIKISSRAIIGVLAGQIKLERFIEDTFGDLPNFFELNLQKGNLFKNIRIEKHPDSDDDYIVFECAHDPAISPFIEPISEKE